MTDGQVVKAIKSNYLFMILNAGRKYIGPVVSISHQSVFAYHFTGRDERGEILDLPSVLASHLQIASAKELESNRRGLVELGILNQKELEALT